MQTNVNDPVKPRLFISYRVFGGASRFIPPLFNGDKFLLFKVAFRSFVAATDGVDVKLHVLLEADPKYEDFIRANWPRPELVEFKRISGETEKSSWRMQCDEARTQEFSDIAGIVEDDYLWLPHSLRELWKLFRYDTNINFATPFDCVDTYSGAHKAHRPQLAFVDQLPFWKTIAWTTSTFFTRRTALVKYRRLFNKYRTYNKWIYMSDVALWTTLNHNQIFNPFFFVRMAFINPMDVLKWIDMKMGGRKIKYGFKYFTAHGWLMAWLLGSRWILFNRKDPIWSPTPGLAHHMNTNETSTGYNWNSLMSEAIRKESGE